MEWQLVLALVLVAPLILLPVAFIWYLNVSGLYKVMREARKRRVAHDRRERALARERT
jgi:hypothetical protein